VIESGASEVLVDEDSIAAKAALSGPVENLVIGMDQP
jgi:hypothetical protein